MSDEVFQKIKENKIGKDSELSTIASIDFVTKANYEVTGENIEGSIDLYIEEDDTFLAKGNIIDFIKLKDLEY